MISQARRVDHARSASPTVTPVLGTPNLLLGDYDVASLGYDAAEYFVHGTACSYAPATELDPDGRWSVARSGEADYTTRIVVLTPTDLAACNGTVIVEWLNVSGGIDAPAVWFMAHREMVREGYVYVAVSAQQVGVQGGVSINGGDMSLKTLDPDRYSSLTHPGDAFSYDIYSQIGRLMHEAGRDDIMGSLHPQYVLAAGESQSARFLTTYVNAIDPLAAVYDGFLIDSRFAPAAALDGTSVFGSSSPLMPDSVMFRPDLRVPVLTVITETDLLGHAARLGYYRARQPDNELLRIWEIPGSAHADNYTIRVTRIDTGSAPLDELVSAYSPTDTLMGEQLAQAINFAPQHHYVLQAALAGLHRWIRTGHSAPSAPRIDVSDSDPLRLALDANGLAMGGIRTPWVDVPIARTSGSTSDTSLMASLFGSGELFDAATLRRLYPGGAEDYLERFTASLDRAIRSGFLLPADQQEILELATATYSLVERRTGP